MAKQHFYSRVPARVSLYKKTDGFDTFAHSAGLDKDFIQSELSVVYKGKLKDTDLLRIRRGELPTVYCQTVLPSGKTAQSALTYLPLDYTRERSAYFAHTLILNDNERSMLFANREAVPFNPAMFLKDVTSFNITAQNASPNVNYPEKLYTPYSIQNLASLTSQYNPDMLKGFIYAIVALLCGKGRPVYFKLPYDDKRVSAEALRFINGIMTVLPYNLREQLSFVTYVNDCDDYEGFLLKCVSRSISEVPVSKGVFFDFERNMVTGLLENELRMNMPLITFLFVLLDNKQIRDEFHIYLFRALATYTDRTLTMSMLGELVFLFWQCSGFYLEQTVLPNDNMVFEFFGIYEKYRDCLVDQHRVKAYKCLERYPMLHLPIPQNIFERVSNFYSSDTPTARRAVLKVVLDLIHTDIMRNKLFDFIRNIYPVETDEVKAIINEDLSRVFYGGFLQQEILGFFDENFPSEPDCTKSVIIDKLLLAIRTKTITKPIVEILDRRYDLLPSNMKGRFYGAYLEMLPECDELSKMLTKLVNKHVVKENPEYQGAVATRILAVLDRCYTKNGNRALLPLLIEAGGFVDEIVARQILTRWHDRPIYSDYVQIFALRSSDKKAMCLVRFFEAFPEMKLDVFIKLLSDLRDEETKGEFGTMYGLINADKSAERVLPKEIVGLFRELIIYPAIINTYYDAFNLRYGRLGIETATRYSRIDKRLRECSQYTTILDYLDFKECVNKEDTTGAMAIIKKFPPLQSVRRNIAEHIRMCLLNRNTQSRKTALIYELSINYLRDGSFRFDAVYNQYRKLSGDVVEKKLGLSATAEKIDIESHIETILPLLSVLSDICLADESFAKGIINDTQALGRVVGGFMSIYGASGTKFLSKNMDNAHFEFKNAVLTVAFQYRPQNDVIGGLLGKIFRG